eukprot:TRINITY_DN7769_c0_g1_i1.p1 TRINITY_DN7769_c0_g1~~TRINITY_DN7769_c0_g1_i1.p1  ORF type:complete len:299 (+),score=46.13 TRINITY_DN7769_c0_g1_i1:38-934(+)
MLSNIYRQLSHRGVRQIGSSLACSARPSFLLAQKNPKINSSRSYANKRSKAMSGIQEKKIGELHSILFQQELYRQTTQEKKWYNFIFKGLMNKKSVMNLNAQALMIHISKQVEAMSWDSLDLPDTFNTWFQLMVLHIWMVVVRCRSLAVEDPRGVTLLETQLASLFWEEVEQEIMLIGETSNPLIVGKNRNLMLKYYMGALVAYDESILDGDAILADAIWRNVFGQDRNITSLENVYKLVEYVRRETHNLETNTQPLLEKGFVAWGPPPLFNKRGNASTVESSGEKVAKAVDNSTPAI